MITLKVSNSDVSKINSELSLKVKGIEELKSKTVLEELANAIFTLSGKAFIKAMNIEAKGNPKKYHHIYEWNRIGVSSQKLFVLYKQSSRDNRLVIKPAFIKSTTKVPIARELLIPGRTGKSVAKRSVFRDKASVMESGKPIIYRASKPLPIPQNGKLRFVAAGTIIKNYNPGGKEVKGSFDKFFNYWFNNKVDLAIKSSGLIEKIDQETARVLNNKNAGPVQVRTAIINLLKQYSKGESIL